MRLGTSSATAAMATMFEDHGQAVESFVAGLPGRCGSGWRGVHTERRCERCRSLQQSETFRSLIPKILRGYALDAIDLTAKRASHAPSSTDVTGARVTVARQFMQPYWMPSHAVCRARHRGNGGSTRPRSPGDSQSTQSGPPVAFGRETTSDADSRRNAQSAARG